MIKLLISTLFIATTVFANAVSTQDEYNDFKRYVEESSLEALTVETWLEMKTVIKESPMLDSATKIVNSEIANSNTLINTLVIDKEAMVKAIFEITKEKIVFNKEFNDELGKVLFQNQKNNLCIDPYTKLLLKKGMKYHYDYLLDDIPYTSFDIDYSQCNTK